MKMTLLPCPFCDGEADLNNFAGGPDNNKVNVRCLSCGAETKRLLPPFHDMATYERTARQAEAMWNQRTE